MNQDINKMGIRIICNLLNRKTHKNKIKIYRIWFRQFWQHLVRRAAGLKLMTIKKIFKKAQQ